jgi:NAD-dependent SIR2 family protein deacetylase
MTTYTETMLVEAHKQGFKNRAVIETGTKCGCFHCGRTFERNKIVEWVDDDLTPLCPHCNTDAVLGEHQGFPLSKEFLDAMYNTWFTPSSN